MLESHCYVLERAIFGDLIHNHGPVDLPPHYLSLVRDKTKPAII
jgi:hypothetical protein